MRAGHAANDDAFERSSTPAGSLDPAQVRATLLERARIHTAMVRRLLETPIAAEERGKLAELLEDVGNTYLNISEEISATLVTEARLPR